MSSVGWLRSVLSYSSTLSSSTCSKIVLWTPGSSAQRNVKCSLRKSQRSERLASGLHTTKMPSPQLKTNQWSPTLTLFKTTSTTVHNQRSHKGACWHLTARLRSKSSIRKSNSTTPPKTTTTKTMERKCSSSKFLQVEQFHSNIARELQTEAVVHLPLQLSFRSSIRGAIWPRRRMQLTTRRKITIWWCWMGAMRTFKPYSSVVNSATKMGPSPQHVT